MKEKTTQNQSRRKFIENTGKLAIAAPLVNLAFAPGTSSSAGTIKVGLIGCGGRGTGAAVQALKADPQAQLVAMADVFEDRLQTSYENLLKESGKQVKVKKKHRFLGFDAYKELIAADVDVVLLATPPAFRPDHLKLAVEQGKHVFTEKPMAVDAPGLRKVIEASKAAKAKGLSLVSGFCWRYDLPKRAIFSKIAEGAIGEVRAVYNTYNSGALWEKARQPEWSDFENQMRNWVYYNWLSGDHIAEQAVHSLDMMSWAFGDAQPLNVSGTGGRQSRTEARYGNVFDHFALCYEYPNGARGFHVSRQQKGTDRSYAVEVIGSKGTATIDCIRGIHRIDGAEKWRYRGEAPNMYQTEHDELFASIRAGKPLYDGDMMSQSTMLAIMGRMTAYTGKDFTYEEALNDQAALGPEIDAYTWDMKWPSAPVAQPGLSTP